MFKIPSDYSGFPGGSEVKASASNVGDPGSIPGSGRSPGEGNGQSTPVFLPGESHGRRKLVDYSPQGRIFILYTECGGNFLFCETC